MQLIEVRIAEFGTGDISGDTFSAGLRCPASRAGPVSRERPFACTSEGQYLEPNDLRLAGGPDGPTSSRKYRDQPRMRDAKFASPSSRTRPADRMGPLTG